MALLAPMHPKAEEYAITPREAALLPEYCKYSPAYQSLIPGGKDESKIKQWYEIMGGSYPPGTGMFHHMHHYCRGLQHRNYAKFFSKSKQEREFRLGASIDEFNYVIGHAEPDFKLMPEFLTMKGESLIALGKAPLAVVEFQRAMQLKPDYWPPYVALSNYYKNIGNPKLAREVLQQALSFSPDAQAVKRRLAELDGVKAKPKTAAEPAAKPVAEAVK
jgi:tetratricopeptide (TPR) repeat protein